MASTPPPASTRSASPGVSPFKPVPWGSTPVHWTMLRKLGAGGGGSLVVLAELPPEPRTNESSGESSPRSSGGGYASNNNTSSTVAALKFVSKSDVLARSRVHRIEAEYEVLRMQHAERHPFIVQVHSLFASKGLVCFAMSPCEASLRQVLGRLPGRRLPSEEVARRVLAEVLVTIEFLHAHGFVYRDLKPDNILVRSDGHIVLTDFDLTLTPSGTVRHTAPAPPPANTGRPHTPPSQETSTRSPHRQLSPQSRLSNSVKNSSLPASFGSQKKGSDESDRDSLLLQPASVPPRSFSWGGDGVSDLGGSGAAWSAQNTPTRNTSVLSNSRRRSSQGGTDPFGSITAAAIDAPSPGPAGRPRRTSLVGTAEYISPEVLRDEQPTPMCDVWGLGVLAYELIYGATPFNAGTDRETMHKVEHGTGVPQPGLPVSREFRSFVEGLLIRDPTRRLRLEDARDHRWFRDINFRTLNAACEGPLREALATYLASTPQTASTSSTSLSSHLARFEADGIAQDNLTPRSVGGGDGGDCDSDLASIGGSASVVSSQHSHRRTFSGGSRRDDDDAGANRFAFFEYVPPRAERQRRSAEELRRVLAAGGVSAASDRSGSGDTVVQRPTSRSASIAAWFRSIDWTCGIRKRRENAYDPAPGSRGRDDVTGSGKQGGSERELSAMPLAAAPFEVREIEAQQPTGVDDGRDRESSMPPSASPLRSLIDYDREAVPPPEDASGFTDNGPTSPGSYRPPGSTTQ